MLDRIVLVAVLCHLAVAAPPSPQERIFYGAGEAPEPYPYLHGGSFSGPDVPGSPDPLAKYVWSSPVNRSALQIYNLRPVAAEQVSGPPSSFSNLGSLLTASPDVAVSGIGTIRLDFGVESPAWLEIDVDDGSVALPIELGIGEMDEPFVLNNGAVKIGMAKQYGSTYRGEFNSELYEGVRFGFININASLHAPFHIKGLRLVCQAMPVEYSASFGGNDTALSAIWSTAVYTVRTNDLPSGFGAILIDRGDRRAWVGDDHVAQATAMTGLGGAHGVVLDTLLVTANNTNHGIETYSLYWILSLADYSRWSGDGATAAKLAPVVLAKLAHARTIWNTTTTRLRFVGWDDRLGSGFVNSSCTESRQLYRFLAVRAHLEGAETLQAAGAEAAAKEAREAGMALWAAIQAGGYTSEDRLMMHSAAELINTGLLSQSDAGALADRFLNDELSICSLSSFNMYWIVQALGRAGRSARAVAAIKRCWGTQIEFGATTFWEINRPEWPAILPHLSPIPGGENGYTSACHPWSSGAAPWMSANLLGVRPRLLDGRVLVAPAIAAADWAGLERQGTAVVSTGGTRLAVTVRCEDDECVVRVGASPGSQPIAVLLGVVPDGVDAGPVPQLEAKGSGLVAHRALPPLGRVAASGPVVVRGGGASVELRVRRRGGVAAAPPSPFAPSTYPARMVGTDHTTGGSWRGKYGSSGFVFFSYNKDRSDLVKLPDWVSRVGTSFPRGVHANWVTDSSDPRALEDPSGGPGRALGAVATTMGATPTMGLDVTLADSAASTWRSVSLYVVDWDHRDRRQTISPLVGFPHLNPAEETVYISNNGTFANNGIWITYHIQTSMRFRVNWIRGDNVVVSAIAFDSAS